MNEIFTKALDTLILQAKKIPEFLLMICIFTFFFEKQAKTCYLFISDIAINVLPNSLMQFFKNLQITHEQFFTVWSSLLALMFIIFLWNFIKHIILTPYDIDLELGGENLIFINSIILPSVFIYNNISDTANKLTINFLEQDLNLFYSLFVFLGFIFFILLYSLIYLRPIFGVFTTITGLNIRTRYKIGLIAGYLVILSKLLAELGKTIIGL